MDKKEVVQLLAYMSSIFPNYYKENNTDVEMTATSWAIMLRGYENELVRGCAFRLASTKFCHPSISEIIELANKRIEEYKIAVKMYENTHYMLPNKCKECEIYDDNMEVLIKCGAILCPRSKAFMKMKTESELKPKSLQYYRKVINEIEESKKSTELIQVGESGLFLED